MLSSENKKVLNELIKKIPPEKMKKLLNDDDKGSAVVFRNIQ